MKISPITNLWITFVLLIDICYFSYTFGIEVGARSIRIRYEYQIKNATKYFTHTFNKTLFDGIKSTNCSIDNRHYCLQWASRGQLRISRVNDHCENYQLWTTLDKELKVTFDLTDVHLYGGSEVINQTWPIKATDGQLNSFSSKDWNAEAILEPFWITSTGFYLLVEEKVPLFQKFDGPGGQTKATVHSRWHGPAAFIDFTNPDAVNWYRMRLQNLLNETGIDSFEFAAAEATHMPQLPIFHTMQEDHPDTMLKAYVATAASFGKMVEVRSARRTHQYAIFTRMMDRESDWTRQGSLSTVIPEVLHLNVIGYPYVIPDTIGGNRYRRSVNKEIYIRWLQLCTFMPVLEFSYPPWDFDKEVVNITRKYVQLHKRYAPKIYKLMNLATVNAIMVNAPLWWIDPTDPIALTIDTSEFLMGDVLVAPVLEQGAKSRDIYFPKGTWRDEVIKGAPLINGPKWIRGYPAGLEVLPYFTKVIDFIFYIISK